jgi:hypothetical protein
MMMMMVIEVGDVESVDCIAMAMIKMVAYGMAFVVLVVAATVVSMATLS